MRFFAPKDDNKPTDNNDPTAELADTVYDVIAALPDHTAGSLRLLLAQLRQSGHQVRDVTVRDVVDDLIVTRRIVEVPGKRGAKAYQAILTASRQENT